MYDFDAVTGSCDYVALVSNCAKVLLHPHGPTCTPD